MTWILLGMITVAIVAAMVWTEYMEGLEETEQHLRDLHDQGTEPDAVFWTNPPGA